MWTLEFNLITILLTIIASILGLNVFINPSSSSSTLSSSSSSSTQSQTSYVRENATFLTLCRNEDLYDILETIQNVEDRFNKKFHYDWVFLNDKPFESNFKKQVENLISGDVKFGTISKEHWSLPDHINKTYMHEKLDDLKGKVIYGESESYRHMCRWFSGFFQWNELLLDYKYYWRVEPGVKFYCDVNYDVFKHMRINKKKYSFIITIFEYKITIPNLFPTVLKFFQVDEYKELISEYLPIDSLYDFIITDDDYNLCHFWTNFEIGDLDFFRNELYTKYFQFLDKTGGFFYERWGDGPVRSIFLSLFLSKDEIEWIDSFGYLHPPYLQCPKDEKVRIEGRCSCDETRDFTYHDYSCTPRYLDVIKG